MHEAKSYCAKKLPLILFACTLASGVSAAVSSALGRDIEQGCGDTVSIDPGDSYRGLAGETTCYRLDLHSSGVLLVSAATPTSAPTEPKLRLRYQPEAGMAAVVARSPSVVVLRIREPGSYLLEVGPQDSRKELGEHIVISRFFAETDAVAVEIAGARESPAPQVGEDGELGPILIASPSTPQGGEDGELGPILIASPSTPQSGEDGELGPILIVAPPADDSASNTFWVRGRTAKPLAARFYYLCHPNPADDHDDLFACASRVRPGERVGGEVVNGWTDDLDAFTFLLSEQRTVSLKIRSAADLAGALYDRWGQRLATVDADDAGDAGGSFRLMRTLAPGRYFFRIEGRNGAQGRYSLTLAVSPW